MTSAPAPAVEAAAVAVQFGTYTALERVSFTLPADGFLALIGPNGAGKSTLIRAVLGLVELREGTLRVFGGAPCDSAWNRVGYIPQIKTLDRQFPALPIELVVSGLRGTWPWRISAEERTKAMAALARVGMEAKATRPIGQLSGGELQRIYLARALVRTPALLILDEPATGMDALGEADMYRLLEEYREDHHAAVLMITHDWEVARHHATHVLLINRQQIAFGDPQEVLNGDLLRRAYGHMGHAHTMTLPLSEPHGHSHSHAHDHGHSHDHHHGHRHD